MKKTFSAALLTFSLLPNLVNALIVIDGDGNTIDTGGRNTIVRSYPGCHNVYYDVYCGPCELGCITVKRANSIIVGGALRYFTWSDDYKNATSSSGCSPCGGSSGNDGSGLPALDITRFFEPESYTREHLTFGSMHGMKKYDQRLQFTAGHSAVTFDDYGGISSKRAMEFNPAQQCWRERNDRKDRGVASLHLFDAAGLPIITSATRNNAHTAILLSFDGSTVHYQVMWDANGNGIARPIAFLDRHGNAIEIEYTDAQPAFGTPALDGFRPYFRKSVMRDAHGREAQFTYQTLFGKQVCTKIDLPNGEEINYKYISGASLSKVIHADGTESIWERTFNATTKLDEYTFIDAKSDPGHRRKRVYLQSGQGFTVNGGITSTVKSRVRRAQNGQGEFTWDSTFSNDASERLLYYGGNSVVKLKYNDGGKGLNKAQHTSNSLWKGNFHQGDSSTWTSETEIDARQNNANHFPISNKDTRNRTRTDTRDVFSNEKLGGLSADGTNENITRNAYSQPLVSTDRLGRITTKTYSPLGDLLTNTTATGTSDETTTTNIYNTRGQVIETRDALYDANFPELHNTRYEYNSNGFLVKKIDSADIAGGTRPESILAYDTAGRLTTSTDPAGRVVTYAYDAENRIVSTTYSDTSTELVEYGTGLEANLIKKTTDRNGYETTYQYDAADRVTQTITAANTDHPIVETCTYLVGTRLKETCTINGSKTTYTFDHRNRVIATTVHPTEDTSLTSSTEIDEIDRTRSTTDAYGRKTFYLYDQNDNITRTVTETVPGGLTNVPAFTTGASQTSANFNYTLTDKDGNTLATNPNNDKRTHLVTYTDPRDLFLKNLTRNLSPNAPYLITDSITDAEGQTLISTDARGSNTWMQYDKLGRNTLTIIAVGTPEEIRSSNGFDDNSNLVETKSARHFSENINAIDMFAYNGRNMKSSHTTAPSTPEEATQSWTYYLDGTANEHTDFRGNIAKQIWHTCCARLQASIDRDGQSTTIYNTDHKGQAIHSATVSQNPAGNWHNPVDADTLQEVTSRFDGRGRTTHTTVWLSPLGSIFASCCGGAGSGILPIAGLEGVASTEGLTTSYQYDDNLTDGLGLDATYATQLAQLNLTFGPKATGSAVSVTNPAGETSVQIQDGIGRTVMTINPEGHTATMAYDEIVSDIDLWSISQTQANQGALLATSATDSNGNTNKSYTDGAGRTIAAEDADGNLSGAAYDANSNTILTADPNGLGQTCIYDSLNRQTNCADKQEQAENTSRLTTYNAASQVITSTNADGETTSNAYDERNRLINSTDANNITTSYAYDANNNLISLTDGKNATRSWTYDLRNLKVTKSMPDANDTLSYSHDALGRIKQETRQDNSTVELTYDLAGRMTEREYSDSTTDEFTYDEASRLTSATKGRHEIAVNRTYADDGAMLSESYVLDGRTYTLQRSYDNGNRVASQTFADGKVMTWTHNARDLVSQAHYDGDLVLTQAHDPAFRLTNQTFGNALARNITYNRQDNLRTADIVSDGNNPIDELNFAYSYAADKNVLAESQTNGILEDLSFTAAYDAGNRVISYNRQDAYLGARVNQSWSYDNAGNWNSTTIDGNTQNRTHSDSDQLQSIAGDNFTQDPRGNQLTDNRGNEYTWDLDNRIIKAEGNGYTDIEYRYDALGRRIVRKQGSDKEVLLWWNNTEQSEHKHQAGQTTIQNDLQANPSENALNTIFARALEGNKQDIQYFHKNYLDHVMAVSDDSGDILEHYRYTALGEPEIYNPAGTKLISTAIDNDILWNVRRYESATKLFTYKYRDFDAITGRWLSEDPIEERGGVNLYGFVGNNPISNKDRFGLATVEAFNFIEDAERIAAEWYPGVALANLNSGSAALGYTLPTKFGVMCYLVVDSTTNCCTIECEVQLDIHIYLNEDIEFPYLRVPKTEFNPLWAEDVYGHEQRHAVLLKKAAVTVEDDLKKEEYETCRGTQDKADELSVKYRKILIQRVFDAGGHSDDETALGNPSGPATHSGYTPLVDSPPIPPQP